jgi:hypothetical protein
VRGDSSCRPSLLTDRHPKPRPPPPPHHFEPYPPIILSLPFFSSIYFFFRFIYLVCLPLLSQPVLSLFTCLYTLLTVGLLFRHLSIMLALMTLDLLGLPPIQIRGSGSAVLMQIHTFFAYCIFLLPSIPYPNQHIFLNHTSNTAEPDNRAPLTNLPQITYTEPYLFYPPCR